MSLLTIFSQTTDYSIDPTPLLETPAPTVQESSGFGVLSIFWIALLIFTLICSAKIFTKAGRKWWEAIIPIYNLYVFMKIVGRPGWWLLLIFVPFVNIAISVILSIDLAKSFGKSTGIGVLTFFFSVIMYAIFAFNKDYQYVGPAASPGFQPGQSAPPSSPNVAGPNVSSPSAGPTTTPQQPSTQFTPPAPSAPVGDITPPRPPVSPTPPTGNQPDDNQDRGPTPPTNPTV